MALWPQDLTVTGNGAEPPARPLSLSLPVGPGSALTTLGTIPYTPAFMSFGHTLMWPHAALRIKAKLPTGDRLLLMDRQTIPSDLSEAPDSHLAPFTPPDPPPPSGLLCRAFCWGCPLPQGRDSSSNRYHLQHLLRAFSDHPSLLRSTPCLILSPGHAIL